MYKDEENTLLTKENGQIERYLGDTPGSFQEARETLHCTKNPLLLFLGCDVSDTDPSCLSQRPIISQWSSPTVL